MSVKFSAGVAVPVFAFGGRTVVQNGSFLTSAFQHLLKQNLVQGCQNKRKVLVDSRLDDLIVPELVQQNENKINAAFVKQNDC